MCVITYLLKMSINNDYVDAKSWPFEEAKKIVEKVKCSDKEFVLFETGYGPSGLPHIGTFGEVLRTTMVMNAFKRLSDRKCKLIAFSDDMDGFRKVPDNVPNKAMLEQNLGKPLTDVPDPFEKYESFAVHNNAMLCRFLDSFGFEYDFKSSTELYKSGYFNSSLLLVLKYYDEIMKIMLPSLREERQQTYSPFLPISKINGVVLQVPIMEYDLEKATIKYEDPAIHEVVESSILNGECKLQWKVDWGMRWTAFGIDYEMSGKDLIDSVKLSSEICKTIGGQPPINLTYELFLDNEGKKISKSKGNGLSIDEWLKYAPQESLSYYMYQSPKRAKRLFFDVIPAAQDEYIDSVCKFNNGDGKKCDNPVFHIHNGNPPKFTDCPKFSMLLNLVQTCNTLDKDVLFSFVKKYAISDESQQIIKKMCEYAVKYYQDFVAGTLHKKTPNQHEKEALIALCEKLKNVDGSLSDTEMQAIVFFVGNEFYSGRMRDWFVCLYTVLFGTESGPRMGTFINIYGVKNTIKLIEASINK